MAKTFSTNQTITGSISDQLSGQVVLDDDDCRLEIGDASIGNNFRAHLKHGARVVIGEGCRLGSLEIYAVGASVTIGSKTGFTAHTGIHCHEGKSVLIGERCIFGPQTLLSTSDMHSIIDLRTHKRTNYPADISIADHVWVGYGATVLKGSTIAPNCVIGCGAVVTQKTKVVPNAMFAGNPAHLIRTNVTWSEELIPAASESAFLSQQV